MFSDEDKEREGESKHQRTIIIYWKNDISETRKSFSKMENRSAGYRVLLVHKLIIHNKVSSQLLKPFFSYDKPSPFNIDRIITLYPLNYTHLKLSSFSFTSPCAHPLLNNPSAKST